MSILTVLRINDSMTHACIYYEFTVSCDVLQYYLGKLLEYPHKG